MTALEFVTGALRLLQVLDVTETPDAATAEDGRRRLNLMMGSWGIQPGTIPFIRREVFDLVANQGGPSNPYTIGDGGDFDVDQRPNQITGVGLLLGGSTPPVEIPRAIMTTDAFEANQVKTLTNPLFTDLYYRPTYPLGTIILWPVPNTADNDIVLYWPQQLSEFADLSTDYDLPQGTAEAIEYNLAIRLAPANQVQVPPDVRQLAVSSLAAVKRQNLPLVDLPQDPALTANNRFSYDIQTGLGG